MRDVLKIKANGTHDELIRRKPLVDHIRVIDDVTTEKEGATDGVDQVHRTIERNEHPDDASHDCGSNKIRVISIWAEKDAPSAIRPPNSHGPSPEKSY